MTTSVPRGIRELTLNTLLIAKDIDELAYERDPVSKTKACISIQGKMIKLLQALEEINAELKSKQVQTYRPLLQLVYSILEESTQQVLVLQGLKLESHGSHWNGITIS